MLDESGRCIAVGITGASGALYAVRTIAALLSQGCRVELVASSFGRRLLCDELGELAAIDRLLDGGIDADTAPLVYASGARMLVAGSAIYTPGLLIEDGVNSIRSSIDIE